MARYMGPTAGVSKILEKLFSYLWHSHIIWCADAKLSTKFCRGVMKKCLHSRTRLEGTLNQIRIKCPSRIANHEVPWPPQGPWLFHGVKKHVRDSVRYLYAVIHKPPTQNWLSLQGGPKVKQRKAKVKARSATTTEVPSGSKELGDQIARLMAAL